MILGRQLFISLQLLNIYELNSYQIGLFMYSYTKGSLPSAFSNYFSLNNTIMNFINIIPGLLENFIWNSEGQIMEDSQ